MIIKENIYNEGGAAGHMSHPQDIEDFTFGDIRQMISDVFSCNVGPITEKLDGQNGNFTIGMDGEVKLARKPSDLYMGGMSLNDIRTKWNDAPNVKEIFENAYFHCTDIFKSSGIGADFFNEKGYHIWANCEIMYANHRNVMEYPNKPDLISVHNLKAVDNEGNEVELPSLRGKLETLKKVFSGVQSKYGKAQVTPNVVIKQMNDNDTVIKMLNLKLDRVMAIADADDSTTFLQWRQNRIMDQIMRSDYAVFFTSEETKQCADVLVNRWVKGIKQPTRAQIAKNLVLALGKERGGYYANMIKELDEKIEKIIKVIMRPLDNFFMKFGNIVISRCEGLTNEGVENEVIDSITNSLKSTQEAIQASDDPSTIEKMMTQLDRLKSVDNGINAAEGIVFEFKGKTLKLTGSFAAVNQILGLGRYNR